MNPQSYHDSQIHPLCRMCELECKQPILMILSKCIKFMETRSEIK